jgi:hypothetical protein
VPPTLTVRPRADLAKVTAGIRATMLRFPVADVFHIPSLRRRLRALQRCSTEHDGLAGEEPPQIEDSVAHDDRRRAVCLCSASR